MCLKTEIEEAFDGIFLIEKSTVFRSSGLRIYKFNFETALSFWRCRFILSHNVPRIGDGRDF